MHLKLDNLFRQLKMELCVVEDYEIPGWFVCWITLELLLKHAVLAAVLNYDTPTCSALIYKNEEML